ncbi:hypothetical protein EOD41_07555 [Mucilaginibacter limnophilus]|uniref:Uncharacterized protein n=1 Tax=Mucilaginibacter limnophilus TaxID=1932778 RepID=A0A437MVX4_9SPHI|nr:hypothetical protein [Mucilaginibacter limnophilus]RVU01805.1 hypothetical protein EOD41_07555 [Mucilaginibacter limnophilus]
MPKKNFISKNWLKLTDKAAYKHYKAELDLERREAETHRLYHEQITYDPVQTIAAAKSKGFIYVTHSGNAGDIIYALPTLKKLHELSGADINLLLKLNRPIVLNPKYTHPLGNVMLNQKMADMLSPLIEAQPYIASCRVYNGDDIDIDLDNFRTPLIPMDKGNIARWCSYLTGISPDLHVNWLDVEADNNYNDTIVLARSERYRNDFINHQFLNQYPNKVFIGVDSEYNDMKRMLPDLKRVEIQNFTQMASIIAGCKFFIGNQSFPFAIAEALKVPRILELSFEVINVVPEGGLSFDFLFQKHFENYVATLNNS